MFQGWDDIFSGSEGGVKAWLHVAWAAAGSAGAKYTTVGSRQSSRSLLRSVMKGTILLSPLYLEESQPQSSNNERVFIKLCIVMIKNCNSDTEAIRSWTTSQVWEKNNYTVG